MNNVQQELSNLIAENSRVLQELTKNGATMEEMETVLKRIREGVYRLKTTLDDEKELLGWKKVENRMIRSNRLLELNAPKEIISHEVYWLELMIAHLRQIFNGLDPKLIHAQEEDLKFQLECQEDL